MLSNPTTCNIQFEFGKLGGLIYLFFLSLSLPAFDFLLRGFAF